MSLTMDKLLSVDYDYIANRIIGFISSYARDAGASGAVIGLSGGVDSSVTAALSVKALGADNVIGVIMPSTATPRLDVDDARRLAQMLGIKYYEVPVDGVRDAITKAIPIFSPSDRLANGNILPRARMTILYYFANRFNMMVMGTGDKSEILIGYFTKYGDGGVDLLPIGDVYKGQVRRLGMALGVPQDIAMKPSSPRLWEGQTAEGELGISYDDVDVILHALVDLRMAPEEAIKATGKPESAVMAVWRRVINSEHKRRMPPIPRIGLRTVGLDWRMPLNREG